MSTEPNQADVAAVRNLLDLMANFESNDQRARYLLSSNWMCDRDAAVKAAALPTLTDLADMLRETFTAEPGGVTWEQAAESVLALINEVQS